MAEIWWFFDFSRWRPPPSWFSKFQIFNGRKSERSRGSNCVKAIKREYRSRGSSWALERANKDSTGQEWKKVTKGLYFTYLWRSPHWSDVHEKLFSRWCSRRNHVCQVSKWTFQGLQFYRSRIFFYWFLNRRYNSATLLRCLWYTLSIIIKKTRKHTHAHTHTHTRTLPPCFVPLPHKKERRSTRIH